MLIVGHHDNCGLLIYNISPSLLLLLVYLTELNPISCDRIHWENTSSWVKYQSQGKKRVTDSAINSDSQDIEEVHMTEALGPNVSQSEFQFQGSITGKFSS